MGHLVFYLDRSKHYQNLDTCSEEPHGNSYYDLPRQVSVPGSGQSKAQGVKPRRQC